MKQLLLLMILFYETAYADPLIVISIMVKNEESVMRATLEPFLQAGLKDYLVYDTGSTDNTVEVTRALFHEYGLSDTQAYIIQEPFVDFSTSRNRALDLVDEKFPDALFTLMPDAEWYIKNVPELIDFCEQRQTDTDSAYFLQIIDYHDGNIPFTYFSNRLIRTHARARFVGAIHESLNAHGSMSIKLPRSIFFEWKRSDQGAKKSNERWHRDKEILLATLKEKPNDPRTVYYLAQTYLALGDIAHAYAYYSLRTTLSGEPEETFLSHHLAGTLAQKLSTFNPQFTWTQALGHYMNAYASRPSRIEPLIAIALHYYQEHNMPACYLFALCAAETPFPDDYDCVEQYMYDVTRYDILSTCAAIVGEFEIGEWAVHMALKTLPSDQHFLQKLSQYKQLKQ